VSEQTTDVPIRDVRGPPSFCLLNSDFSPLPEHFPARRVPKRDAPLRHAFSQVFSKLLARSDLCRVPTVAPALLRLSVVDSPVELGHEAS
jgi:hypothetical protein